MPRDVQVEIALLCFLLGHPTRKTPHLGRPILISVYNFVKGVRFAILSCGVVVFPLGLAVFWVVLKMGISELIER